MLQCNSSPDVLLIWLCDDRAIHPGPTQHNTEQEQWFSCVAYLSSTETSASAAGCIAIAKLLLASCCCIMAYCQPNLVSPAFTLAYLIDTGLVDWRCGRLVRCHLTSDVDNVGVFSISSLSSASFTLATHLLFGSVCVQH